MRPPRFVLLLGALALSGGLSAWNSAFLSPDGSGGWTPVTQTLGGRAFRLDDYSYCGYKLSEKGLGDGIPCFGVSLTALSGSDITAALAAAVTTVAAAGGGTIHIPAGSFNLSSTVWIKYSNIRIAGAGSANTTLVETSAYTPANSMYYEGPLSFNAGGNPWTPTWTQEAQATAATSSSDIPRGGLTLTAGSTAGFAVGDWVVVQQLFWPALSAQDGAGTWPTTYASNSDWQFSFTYVRKIKALAGTLVTLDAPIPRPLLAANNPVRLFKPKTTAFIQNVGLEGVSIQVQANANNTGSDAGRPAGIAVNFASAFDAWCYDVQVSNTAKHAFQPCWSARVSFLDCSVTGSQDMGGGGFGYAFVDYCSQEVLFKRCTATNTRHGFTHQFPMTSSIVMTQCRTLKPVGVNTPNSDVDDTHFAFCHSMLWDQHYQQNTGIQAMNRGARSGSQTQETLGGGAVWNYDNDGETLNWQAGRVQLSPATYTADVDALVIGVQHASVYDGSEDPNPTTLGTLMTGAAPQAGPRGNVAYEGLGTGGLTPASLFDGQLYTRMGHSLPPELAPNACAPSPTPSPSPLPPSPTQTPTASPSRTATRTPSPASSPTATPSATASATPSGTPSPAPSATASPSVTPTKSPAFSATATVTPSASPTASPSATLAVGTETASPTQSPTFSASPSPSPSASPSSSATESPIPSPSDSPTGSPSPAPSASASPTSLGTLTESPSPSMSATATPSSTPSASGTASPSPTPSPAASPSLTPTPTALPTASLSPTPTPSVSPSATPSLVIPPPPATGTKTLTATPSASPSRSPSASATASATLSATPSSAPVTATATPSLTAVGQPASSLEILEAVPWPNPGPRQIRVRLGQASDGLRIRLYSPALVLMADFDAGPRPEGWSAIALPEGLPLGLVYGDLQAWQGRRQSPPIAPLRLYFIR